MPEFKVHTVESAPPASATLLRGLKEQVGFIPNLAATMAESPTLLEAFLGLRSVAGRSSLDPVAREILAIAVASETGCSYCVAAHSTFALMNGAAPAAVEAVRSGAAPQDSRLEALAAFARAVVRREDRVRERAQDLRKAGLTIRRGPGRPGRDRGAHAGQLRLPRRGGRPRRRVPTAGLDAQGLTGP